MKPRVLFLVEGFTDIRFVVGLAGICRLTMVVPAALHRASGLKARVEESGAAVEVIEIPGNRVAFQLRSLALLWSRIERFDLVLSQEMLRGSLNATAIGALRRVPVLTTLAIDPLAYFRCRRERGEIGLLAAVSGGALIQLLMRVNGRLATRVLALGPYLRKVALRYSASVDGALYYGVDTSLFRPAGPGERRELRRTLGLPPDQFVVLSASRVSHEKDLETAILACAAARRSGLDLTLLNVGGGHQEFLHLAASLAPGDSTRWITARPAAHPMKEFADYVRAVDVLVQASLEEGLGLAPLEALACGTPVVATAVGGMALVLEGYARLTPRRDVAAMTEQILWVASHPDEAREEALRGREHVVREWEREIAFADLTRVFQSVLVSRPAQASAPVPEPASHAAPRNRSRQEERAPE